MHEPVILVQLLRANTLSIAWRQGLGFPRTTPGIREIATTNYAGMCMRGTSLIAERSQIAHAPICTLESC